MQRNMLAPLFALILLGIGAICQAQTGEPYRFTVVKQLDATPVKNQENTGTCWAFASTSFFESELLRMGKGEHDLSEMFIVRNVYLDKAKNYILRQGKTQFGEGGLAHDLLNAFERYGAMPESAYSGKAYSVSEHDHSEMVAAIEAILKVFITKQNGSLSNQWQAAINGIMDAYMGEAPSLFDHKGQRIAPETYGKSLGIKADDYITFTSFEDYPMYESFVLSIPDNFASGSYFNVPLGTLVELTNLAIDKGFTVAWDTDVSHEGFSAKNGIAIVPATSVKTMNKEEKERLFKQWIPEDKIDAGFRQRQFNRLVTTDDHLMHITGKVKDQMQTPYFIVKNSWGDEVSDLKGYLYASQTFFELNTISVTVHKDALSKDLRKSLKLD